MYTVSRVSSCSRPCFPCSSSSPPIRRYALRVVLAPHAWLQSAEPDTEVQVISALGEPQGAAPLGIVLSQGWLHNAVSLVVLGPGGLVLREAMRELAWELPIERLGPKDSFESAAERLAAAECGEGSGTLPLNLTVDMDQLTLESDTTEVHFENNEGGINDHRMTQVWCCVQNTSRHENQDGQYFSRKSLKHLLHARGGRLEYPANEAVERFIQVLDSTHKSSHRTVSCVDMLGFGIGHREGTPAELRARITGLIARVKTRPLGKSPKYNRLMSRLRQLNPILHNHS